MTNLFLLIGNPVAQSISPALWNSAFESLGVDASYHAANVDECQIQEALKGIKALNIKGANVTAPYKEIAAASCYKLHGIANEIGVVNTIKTTSQGFEGWNTDHSSILSLLKGLKPINKAVVLGSGASAKTIMLALRDLRVSKTFQIARAFKENENEGLYLTKMAWNSTNFKHAILESDIIINATTLGWQPEDEIPQLYDYLSEDKVYMDLNYSKSSKLIEAALEKKCKIIDGYEILLQQGIESFNILTGLTPPIDMMKKTVNTIKRSRNK